MITEVNSEDRLVQQILAAHLEKVLGVNNAVGAWRPLLSQARGKTRRFGPREGRPGPRAHLV
jgi:hypothetical protein